MTETKKNNTSTFKAHTSSLKVGKKAPNFKAKDQEGNEISLSDFSGQNLILYFYPKDNTPTCTNEACNLRDEFPTLVNENYAVVGVSPDNEKSHQKFSKKYQLPFPILVDEDLKIIKTYDVFGTKMLFGRVYDGVVRTTFVIDEKGLIKHVIHDVDSKKHAQQILAL